MVKDINPGPEDGVYGLGFDSVNDRLFFIATDGIHGFEPWISDGTELGTVMLQDIRQGVGDSYKEAGFKGVGTRVFFQADDGHSGMELWTVSDVLFVDGFECGDPSAWSASSP